MRLAEALGISAEDETARGALAEHLCDLRQSAAELGLVHLEAAVAETATRLERESFGPASLVAVRVLAWRYESLAVMPGQSGTHPVVEPLERENVRAQLGVAIHREPANQAPKWTYPIWRLNVGAGAGSSENGSGFEMEMQTTPRLLGLGFAILLSATVAFLIWRQVMPVAVPAGSPAAATTPVQATVTNEQVAPAAAVAVAPSSSPDLSAFAGSLRAGVDPSLKVVEGQGVLEVFGPGDVSVDVDGVDRGALPVTLVLDQGRHTVRYRAGAKWTHRFYYVKSDATRALRVLTQPGGLIDAR